MTLLDPRDRRLLASYRETQSPPEASLARILEAVHEAPIVPLPHLDVDPRLVSTPGAGSSIVAKLGASAAAKIIAATVAVSIPAGWWLQHTNTGEPSHPRTAEARPSAVPMQAKAPLPGDSSPPRESRTLQLSDLPLPSTAPRPTPARSASPRANPSSSAPTSQVVENLQPPSEVAPDTLAREVALLGSANQALTAKDPARALTILAEHQERFPNSRLAETRAVTRAIALCQAGRRTEGRAAAEELLRRRPRSPFAERLRSACGTKDEP